MLRSEDPGVHYEAVGVIGNLVHSSQDIKQRVLEVCGWQHKPPLYHSATFVVLCHGCCTLLFMLHALLHDKTVGWVPSTECWHASRRSDVGHAAVK
jgi:hypothetical protein